MLSVSMKITAKLLTLFTVIFPLALAANTSIRFASKSSVPDDLLLVIDDSKETCSAFHTNQTETFPKFTQFRLSVDAGDVLEVNVTLIGTKVGCADDLLVTPISSCEADSWTARWSTCRLMSTSLADGKDTCLFSCNCTETCKEIQIVKRPTTAVASNWTLCLVELLYKVPYGCDGIVSNRSGVYQVNLTPNSTIAHYADVYCDMKTDGGGWTVLLRREDGSVDFFRDWQQYEQGFGSLIGEFWAGNELIHQLTNNGATFLLRFDLKSYDGDYIYAVYEDFYIGPESDNYRLRLGQYWTNSTAGNNFEMQNGMMFSTLDRDNDVDDSVDCAVLFQGAWWFNSCCSCVLTTMYGQYPLIAENRGIKWEGPWGRQKFAKYATMMIRPV